MADKYLPFLLCIDCKHHGSWREMRERHPEAKYLELAYVDEPHLCDHAVSPVDGIPRVATCTGQREHESGVCGLEGRLFSGEPGSTRCKEPS